MKLEGKRRARLLSATVLLLVLGAGFALGMAVERRLGAGHLTESGPQWSGDREPGAAAGGQVAPADSASRRRTLLVEQVGLSAEQKVRVDSIVAFYRERVRELRERFDQQWEVEYGEILSETRSALKAVLNPEQRAAYDSLLMEADRRRQERRQRDTVPR